MDKVELTQTNRLCAIPSLTLDEIAELLHSREFPDITAEQLMQVIRCGLNHNRIQAIRNENRQRRIRTDEAYGSKIRMQKLLSQRRTRTSRRQ